MRKAWLTSIVTSLLVVLFTLAGSSARAQSARGAIAGNVTDASGAYVPNAAITAVSDDNGGTIDTKSTSAGSYRFADVPIGRYTITITAPGFEKKVLKGVPVTINSTSALDVQMANGATSETVTVDASAPTIESETSDISGTITHKQIEDLPLSLAQGVNGMRSPETFEFLVPGTTGPGSATQANSGNGVFFARLSGGQAYGNETLLDGASIQRSENGSSFDETSPSIEVLQEFKVTTSTPSAEFGRTTSGITSFSTKPGTNEFHGLAFGIIKNRVLDANLWYNNANKSLHCNGVAEIDCPYTTPEDSKFDYGGVFDGPVWIPHLYNGHDRTFFTFAWEQYRFKTSGTAINTVPTAAERGGNFADVLGGPVFFPGYPNNQLTNPCTGEVVDYQEIFDPRTSTQVAPGVFCRTQFPGNMIDTPLSPTALSLIANLPLPNQAPQSTDVFGYNGNYAYRGVRPFQNTTYTIRIDQNINQRNKIFASYDTRQNYSLSGVPDFPGLFQNNTFPQLFTTHYERAGWDFSITPTLLNHLNLGYNRTNSNNLSAGYGKDTLTSLGTPGDNSVLFPTIAFPSPDAPANLGDDGGFLSIDNGTRVNDSVSWIKGRQSIKVGIDFRYQQYSVGEYSTDSFQFYRDQTASQNFVCCGSGDPFASFLLGEVGNGSQSVINHRPRWNSHYMAAFVEDDIKVSNNLTLNLGLRYDIDVPRKEASNESSELSLTAPDSAAGGLPGALVFGTNCNCNTAWATTYYKDFGPRAGFAYVLPGTNNKMVLRGGAAILYGPLQYGDFGASMAFGYNQSAAFFTPQTATTGGAFSPAFRLDATSPADPTQPRIGFPAFDYAPNLDPTQLTSPNGPGSFNAVGGEVIRPYNGRPSMTDNWSMQLQYEVAQDLIFTMGYIGQEAQNLRSSFLSNINNIPDSDFGLGDKLGIYPYFIQTQGGTSLSGKTAPYSSFEGSLSQALRPFPQYGFIQGDCCAENLGHSSYNALVTSLARRFRNGFNLQASYTWTKTLTDADSAVASGSADYIFGNGGAGLRQGQGSTNLKLDKAVSAQNIPQQFSLSYLYQLPFGKGRKYLSHNTGLDLLVGGWEVGGIQRYQSGQPISFGCATGVPGYDNCIAFSKGPAAASGFASADYEKRKNGPNFFNQESWFKPAYRLGGTNTNGVIDPGVSVENAAFIDQNNASGPVRSFTPACTALNNGQPCSYSPFSFGNISRVTEAITGPLYLAEDFSVLKNFHIYERFTFQFKAEAFDAFNRHRQGTPDTQQSDACLPGQTGCGGFGVPTYTDYGPRNLQFSGKLFF